MLFHSSQFFTFVPFSFRRATSTNCGILVDQQGRQRPWMSLDSRGQTNAEHLELGRLSCPDAQHIETTRQSECRNYSMSPFTLLHPNG